MKRVLQAPYLVTMATRPDHNSVARFKRASEELDVNDLVVGYEDLVSSAPRRLDAGKSYFVGHDGRPSTGKHTNRIEEHLAIALVNDHPHWDITAHHSVDLLDYQVPLKAHQGDVGIGKIDILGLSNNDAPTIIELKVLGKKRADTPLRAMLEALAYGAIIEANASAVATEIKSGFGRISKAKPDLLIVATDDYWDYWFKKPTSNGWLDSLGTLAGGLARGLNIDIGLVSIGIPELRLGLEGARPGITSGFRPQQIASWPRQTDSPTGERNIVH